MGYTIAAGVLAILASMKFTVYTNKETEKKFAELAVRIEKVEERLDKSDEELPKRTAALMVPVARAIKALNEQVGIQ